MTDTAVDTDIRATRASDAVPQLRGLWWTPLAFVVLSLLLLLLTPLIVDRRAASLRTGFTTGTEPARIAINDLEAAFASRLLADQSGRGPMDTTVVATEAHLNFDQVDLHAAARNIGPTAVAGAERLTELLNGWARTPGGSTSPAAIAQAREFFVTAERLDAYLTGVSNQQRDNVRSLEQFGTVSSVVLALVALIAMLLVVAVARRLLTYARVAERERAEVIRAADARAALLRGVTHDVKNPLGAAAGYAQLLNDGIAGPLTPPQTEMVKRIERLVHTSVRTVTDLLELARADGAGLHLDYEEVNLAALAAECVDDHLGQAHERRLNVRVEGDPLTVVTDPLRVRQILGNLLTNAVKYTPDGGEVVVRTFCESAPASGRGRAAIEVRDNGPGIPPELRGRVFEEFFRVRRSGESVQGNGLGLAISRRLARLVGGDVTFADADPHGAVFTIWLDGRRGN